MIKRLRQRAITQQRDQPTRRYNNPKYVDIK